jgi:hypothetical protein
MFGDPREAIERDLLARATALTTADGLPQTFAMVTRDYTHLADVEARGVMPACLMTMDEPEMTPHLSHVYEVVLPGRFIVCFTSSYVLPASEANNYRVALERMLIQDIHLGGLCDLVSLRGTLMPGIWQEVGLLALGILFSVTFEYDPREAALVA